MTIKRRANQSSLDLTNKANFERQMSNCKVLWTMSWPCSCHSIIIIIIIILIIIITWDVYLFSDHKDSKHFTRVSKGRLYGARDSHFNCYLKITNSIKQLPPSTGRVTDHHTWNSMSYSFSCVGSLMSPSAVRRS